MRILSCECSLLALANARARAAPTRPVRSWRSRLCRLSRRGGVTPRVGANASRGGGRTSLNGKTPRHADDSQSSPGNDGGPGSQSLRLPCPLKRHPSEPPLRFRSRGHIRFLRAKSVDGGHQVRLRPDDDLHALSGCRRPPRRLASGVAHTCGSLAFLLGIERQCASINPTGVLDITCPRERRPRPVFPPQAPFPSARLCGRTRSGRRRLGSCGSRARACWCAAISTARR